MRPRLIDGLSNRSDDSRANGRLSICRKVSMAFSTGLAPPTRGEPWGAAPAPARRARARRAGHLDAHREHALRLNADVEVRGLAGDREVADVALPHEVVRAAILDLLGLLLRHARQVAAHR